MLEVNYNPTPMNPSTLSSSEQLWEHLQQAIASSSGFHQWQEEQPSKEKESLKDLESQVCSYLRETLETLAY
ncbi:MAG: hypothetical protein RLZZ148_2578 [Cyanobacteriota bacterium]